MQVWRSARYRNILIQVLVFAALVFVVSIFARNAILNLEKQGIASGFGFLDRTAGFDIIMHLIPYDESSTYGRAFVVGLLNTLLVSGIGIVVATFLGLLIGILRLSPNWLMQKISALYIEVFRNIPLLLQLFFWYFAVLRTLPPPRESLSLGQSIFLNNRGLYLPWINLSHEGNFLSIPHLEGFNFEGGIVLIPEFVALVASLSIYTAAFIAEIIRAGILGIPKGQSEAALSLGFSRWQMLRLVILPQAMRIIIPPLTSQYLNLTKNSSLAAAIAYPDLVLIFAGTVLTQTGQALEVIFMTMAVYLTISLAISIFMNWFNSRMELRER